jgi:phosphate-selective porin OprO/OprP
MYINQQPPGLSVPASPGYDSPAIQALIDQRIKAHDEEVAKKKKADDDAKAAAGTDVVNNVPVTVTFNNSFWMSAADNAFRVRVGAYAQYDTSWWNQNPNTIPPVVAPNVSEGFFQDGMFVRRMRVELEGTLWETWEFQVYPEFEGVNRLLFDELWFGAKEIPIIGTLRMGKDKTPQGMESIGSSKDVWFMERSALFDSFEDEYMLGIFQTRTFLNERATMMLAAGRWDLMEFNGNIGSMFDTGGWNAVGRLTALPIYEDDGRYLLHLGVSGQWRQPNLDWSTGQITSPAAAFPAAGPANPGFVLNPGLASAGTTTATVNRVARFRTRPDIRDAVGSGDLTNNQGQVVTAYPFGDSTRVIDTGLLSCTDVTTVATELYAVWGRFSVLNETSLNYVNNAGTIGGTGAVTPIGNQFFWGTSTQVSCFLTGESRTYNKRYGTYARVIPNENAWLVRDEDGSFNGGLGAWEILFRHEFVNESLFNNLLPGAPALTTTAGYGNSYTAGLNWHLNPNMRIMFNYTLFDRVVNLPAGGVRDQIQGFGTRFHFQF